MCIRDSRLCTCGSRRIRDRRVVVAARAHGEALAGAEAPHCLLYTSDAADERSRVDLGGRRILKNKKK